MKNPGEMDEIAWAGDGSALLPALWVSPFFFRQSVIHWIPDHMIPPLPAIWSKGERRTLMDHYEEQKKRLEQLYDEVLALDPGALNEEEARQAGIRFLSAYVETTRSDARASLGCNIFMVIVFALLSGTRPFPPTTNTIPIAPPGNY